MEPSRSEALRSPLASWQGRFRDDFWFYPGPWFRGTVWSYLGILKSLFLKTPGRLAAWWEHWLDGAIDTAGWLRERGPVSRTSIGLWWARLLTKTLDIFLVGELIGAFGTTIKHNTRALYPHETAEARRVFGSVIDYNQVRLDQWSFIAHIGNYQYLKSAGRRKGSMATTVFNTINFTRTINTMPGSRDMAWLVHELTHVLQYQLIGGQFMIEALAAQGKEGYDYGGPEALIERDFADFNGEQQGDITRDYYLALAGKRKLSRAQLLEYERVIAQMRAGEI